MSALSDNKPIRKLPPSLPRMIVEDLGYCCPEIFFMIYQSKQKVADRLGLAPDTVKKWKSRIEKGECNCHEREGCLKLKLKKADVRSAAKAIKR